MFMWLSYRVCCFLWPRPGREWEDPKTQLRDSSVLHFLQGVPHSRYHLCSSPFLYVFFVSGLQIWNDLRSIVSLNHSYLISLLTHFNFIQHQAISFSTSTFFYYFAIPPGMPTEEALGHMIIYMKRISGWRVLVTVIYCVPWVPWVIISKRFCSLYPGMQTLDLNYSGPLSLQGSDLDYQWHHLFYCHYLARPRGSLSLAP